MTYTADQLKQQHPEFSKNYKRWRFYRDSYQGGTAYSVGEYLTRYVYESNSEYINRIEETPYDNHTRSVVEIYNSFLFGQDIKRDYGQLDGDPLLEMFLEDADYEGRDFTDFMREAHTLASVYGHSWVIVDKPNMQTQTRAEELALGIRPYLCVFSAENVTNWHYTRTSMGSYELDYLQVIEEATTEYVVYRVYTPGMVEILKVTLDDDIVTVIEQNELALGYIPAVCVYANRGQTRGCGVSDVSDIADINRAIYNETSEITQLIRLSNHPSLVCVTGVKASAGAGAIITMDENTDPGLKPYLLQPSGQSLDGIRQSIADKISSIDRIAHIGSIRGTESRTMSGVAMDSEFKLLQAKLMNRARGLELAEEQIMQIWYDWAGTVWDGTITYPDSYNTRDKSRELDMLEQAKRILSMPVLTNTNIEYEITEAVLETIIDDPDSLRELKQSLELYPETREIIMPGDEPDSVDDITENAPETAA